MTRRGEQAAWHHLSALNANVLGHAAGSIGPHLRRR